MWLLAVWKKDCLWDWKSRVYRSCSTHAGSWVSVQSSQGLQAPALQLRTRTNCLDVICTEKFWYSHHLFCSISKWMERQYFSNCCSVCNLFSQLSVIVSSWHFNRLKWYTVKIFCFPRAKWTFARCDYSLELRNWYLNLCQFFKIRKKKIVKLFLS